jgi:hypothetical protein
MRAVIWKTATVANVTWIEQGGAAAMQQQQLVELHDLIEHGPHWDTIERIEVLRVNQCAATDLAVEQAAEL